jgi:HEAT repeat protein
MKNVRVLFLGFLLAGCSGSKSTQEWIEQLKDKDAALRLEAIKALGQSRGEVAAAVPALAEALGDTNAYVRRDAARALGQFSGEAKAAVPALTAALQDKERSVRLAVAGALKKIDPAATVTGGGD